MRQNRRGKLPADAEHGIERGHGFLEHHADLAAAPTICWRCCGWITSPTTTPARCPADNASCWNSAAH